jgi:hypothetical protein
MFFVLYQVLTQIRQAGALMVGLMCIHWLVLFIDLLLFR